MLQSILQAALLALFQVHRMPAAKQLNAFLRRWDTGTRASRTKQLEEFVARCADMTGPQLEDELENGASLVLTRISAWLRLSYALGHSVALQLQAIAEKPVSRPGANGTGNSLCRQGERQGLAPALLTCPTGSALLIPASACTGLHTSAE